MYSLDNHISTNKASSTSAAYLDHILKPEGLSRDPKMLPLFSLYDLFEVFVADPKFRKTIVKQRLISFHRFLIAESENRAPCSFLKLLNLRSDSVASDLESESLLYNSVIINLFSYAFGLRIELFHLSNNRLSVQYFGLSDKPVRHALLSSDSYVLLKKVLGRSLTFTSNEFSNGASPTSSIIKGQSHKRVVPMLLERVSRNLELERGLSLTTDTSNNGGSLIKGEKLSKLAVGRNLLEVPEDKFNLTKNDQGLRDSGFSFEPTMCQLDVSTPADQSDISNVQAPKLPFCLSKRLKTDNKSTGRLKFYNEAKEYGFIIMDDESEIFVHKADLIKQNIDTRFLAYYKKYYEIFLEFSVQEYQGKGKKHRKAIDILIFDMQTTC